MLEAFGQRESLCFWVFVFFGLEFRPRILASNFGLEFRPRISASNVGLVLEISQRVAVIKH